jgi:hypothetical protein
MTDLLAHVQRRSFRPGRHNALLLVDDSLFSATTWDRNYSAAEMPHGGAAGAAPPSVVTCHGWVASRERPAQPR